MYVIHFSQSAERMMELNYIAHLQSELRNNPPAKKSQRTRARLKIALAAGLEEPGYHLLRLSDVTKAAGLGEGTIYVYFKERSVAIREVMLEFVEDFLQTHVDQRVRQFARAPGASPFPSLKASIQIWIMLGRANPGLLRSLFQFADDDPEFRRQYQRYNIRWIERVSDRILRYRGRDDAGVAVLFTYSLCMLLDELMKRVLVQPDEEFVAVLQRYGQPDDVLAEMVSVIWMKTLYPEAPFFDLQPNAINDIINWGIPGLRQAAS